MLSSEQKAAQMGDFCAGKVCVLSGKTIKVVRSLIVRSIMVIIRWVLLGEGKGAAPSTHQLCSGIQVLRRGFRSRCWLCVPCYGAPFAPLHASLSRLLVSSSLLFQPHTSNSSPISSSCGFAPPAHPSRPSPLHHFFPSSSVARPGPESRSAGREVRSVRSAAEWVSPGGFPWWMGCRVGHSLSLSLLLSLFQFLFLTFIFLVLSLSLYLFLIFPRRPLCPGLCRDSQFRFLS